MKEQDYENKKRECWLNTANHCGFAPANRLVRTAFDSAFDCAYQLGKQEQDADTVIQGWVARDGSGPNDLGLRVYSVKPKRMEGLRRWNGHGEKTTLIDCRLFPDLTWDDNPIEVEIILKRKKNG